MEQQNLSTYPWMEERTGIVCINYPHTLHPGQEGHSRCPGSSRTWTLYYLLLVLVGGQVCGSLGGPSVCVSMAGSPCALLSSQLPVAVCEEGGREEAAWESGSLSLSLRVAGRHGGAAGGGGGEEAGGGWGRQEGRRRRRERWRVIGAEVRRMQGCGHLLMIGCKLHRESEAHTRPRLSPETSLRLLLPLLPPHRAAATSPAPSAGTRLPLLLLLSGGRCEGRDTAASGCGGDGEGRG